MDLIDRLRTYASTRKGGLAELITEAADALERQTDVDKWRPTDYAPSVTWKEWSEI